MDTSTSSIYGIERLGNSTNQKTKNWVKNVLYFYFDLCIVKVVKGVSVYMEPIVYIINLENSNYRPHAQEWGGGGRVVQRCRNQFPEYIHKRIEVFSALGLKYQCISTRNSLLMNREFISTRNSLLLNRELIC